MQWKPDGRCENLLGGDERAPAASAREGRRGPRGPGTPRGLEMALGAARRAVGPVDLARRACPPGGGGPAAPSAPLRRARAGPPRLPPARLRAAPRLPPPR